MITMHRRLAATVTIALAAGCSPAEHTTDPTNSEIPFEAGSLSGAVNGSIGSAQTTNSPHVTLTGLVANFTRLGIVGADVGPGASTVYFATRGDSGTPHLWKINLDSSGLRQLTTDASGQVFPAISKAGDRLVFRDLGLTGGQQTATDLWEWTPAGGPRFLANETGVTGIAGWVPGDTAIVYPVNAGSDVGLRQRNLSGGAVTHLTDSPDKEVTTGIVNGVPTAFFARGNSVYRIDLLTHDTTLFHRELLDNGGDPEVELRVFGPDLSPDGRQLLFWVEDIRFFTLFSFKTDLSDSVHQLGGFPSRGLPWQPEARWSGDTAYVSTIEESRGGIIIPQLALQRIQGGPAQRLTGFPAGILNGFSVGPFLATRPRALIGEGGELGSSASGIIYGLGRQGDLTTVLSFTANRQRSVSLTAETPLNSNAPVLTYTLKADRLTSLAYLADPPEGPAVSVIDSSSAVATGALLTFDAMTGAVALILPFAASVASERNAVTVTDEAGTRVFRGRFAGVWQAGRNLAKQGAGEVRLDLRSGKVNVIP